MNTIRRNGILLAIDLILIAGLAACSQNFAGAKVEFSEEKMTAIIENMLTGYNDGDYTAFSHEMSTAMKFVISENLFKEFVNESKTTLGKFQSITNIQEGDSDNTSSHWVVIAQFENSTEKFNITFDKGSGQIEGMDFGTK